MLNNGTIRYSRPVERPVGRVADPTGKEPVPDILRRIEVGILKMPALATCELALTFAVSPVGEPAGVTPLAGMPWIDPDNSASESLGLVGEKLPELSEGPCVQSSLGVAPAGFHPLSDVSQILNRNGCTGSDTFQNTFTQYVIAIPSEPSFTASEASKVPFGGPRTVGLQFTLQAEAALADFAPSAFAMKAVVAGHGGTADTKIDTKGGSALYERNAGKVYNYVEKELPIPANQISGSGFIADVRNRVGGDREGDFLTADGSGYVDDAALPIYSVGMLVQSRRAERGNRTVNLPAFLLQGQCGFDGFRRFLSRLNVMIGHQIGSERLAIQIRQLVKIERVTISSAPPNGTNVIERFRELNRSLRQAFRLLGGWLEIQFYRSLHCINSTIRRYDYAIL